MFRKKIYISIIIIFLTATPVIVGLFSLGIFANNPLDSVKAEIMFYEDNYALDPFDYRVKVDTTDSYEIVPLSSNWQTPLKRIYSVVYNEYLGISGRSVAVFEVNRENIFSTKWVYKEYKMNQVLGALYSETIDLVSKYDITKDFPGKENYDIVNYSPLSQSDIDRNKQRLETEKQREAELKQAEETWNNMTPQEKIQYIQEKIQKYTASREEIINKYGEEGYNMEIKTLQDQIDEIKKENGLQ